MPLRLQLLCGNSSKFYPKTFAITFNQILIRKKATKKLLGKMRYLTALEAQNLDKDLMTKPGFSIDQLMELAGLSCASAVAEVYPKCKALIVAGPGNNGGDGLVMARHLNQFGFSSDIIYPRVGKGELFENLVATAKDCGSEFLDEMPDPSIINQRYEIIVDAIFGFSFSGKVRPPFDTILSIMSQCCKPIVSIDIPSGWDVEKGNNNLSDDPENNSTCIRPDMLISLTAPKLCARFFKGKHHFMGGRFCPQTIVDKYQLIDYNLYQGTAQCVRLPSL